MKHITTFRTVPSTPVPGGAFRTIHLPTILAGMRKMAKAKTQRNAIAAMVVIP